jgi:BirA family biotin operon repressor/biotin-[acetyl-CoA-carboxylase] ligase
VRSEAVIWRLQIHDTLPSTSEFCRSRAMAGEKAGLAVLARMQTEGRGSRGRAWVGAPGNLFLSVLLRPHAPAREAGLWALLAGVAVADALPGPVTLKWPNDLLRQGAKLGGILIDSATDAEGRMDWLVIGIGVNLAHAPDIAGRDVADLRAAISPEACAADLLDRLTLWQDRRHAEGWSAIRTAWLARATKLGSRMSLKLAEREIEGRFAGLAEDGSLMLETDGGLHSFATGEIWRETAPC